MIEKHRICPVCKYPLHNPHGNRRYHHACAYEKKKRRSIQEYSKLHQALDPLWLNEKILKETYIQYGGSTEIDPDYMENAGFDFNIKKEVRYSGSTTVFVMNNYGFSIMPNRNIIIWKI